jgi:class 3 adenylate cyclase/tetratricopeptide (TPR) repeat protein
MSDVRVWLESLGLGRYADAFEENDIEGDLLSELTDEYLSALGVSSLGHRMRLLKAIRERAAEPRPTPPPVPEMASQETEQAERRQLTVMFSDLVGSTELSSELDPEALRDINRTYQDAAKAAVERFGGYVARYMGDGVLAYFGYPTAHEDDAERAVRAGLELVREVPTLPVEPRLSVRVAVATGPVVVGDIVGVGAAQERAAVGETPNLAAKLQSLAAPNSVVLAESTHRLVKGRFLFRPLGAQSVRGIRDPVEVFEAEGIRTEARLQVGHDGTVAPMVGRGEELGMLLRRWSLTQEGEGQVVLLGGEPGIGKSRIAEALREQIRNGPHTALRYQCSPYYTTSAFHPVIEQMASAAGFQNEDSEETRLDKLASLLEGEVEPVDQALVAELMGLSTARYVMPDMAPTAKRERTIAALVYQLEALAATAPVLVVFEDVHWIDPSTRDLLDATVEMVPSHAILLLITHRPEFDAGRWSSRGQVTQLGLNRLSRRDVSEIVSSVVGSKPLPTDVLEHIHQKTDGVPLFVEELTRDLVESELLLEAEGAYELVGPLPSLSIPSTIHDALTARLDRLGPAKDVAQRGAVLGRTFSYDMVAAVSDSSADELVAALSQLEDAGLVSRRGTPPEASYSFRHALVRDAAYDSLLLNERRRHHAAAAAILDQGDRVDYAVVANHQALAGEFEAAVSCFLRAGRGAARRAEHDEASRHLERALELSEAELTGRPALIAQLEIQRALGVVRLSQTSYGDPAVGEAYARAAELASQLSDDSARFSALRGEWMHFFTSASPDYGLSKADEMLAMATGEGRVAREVIGHQLRGQSLFLLGRVLDAKASLERAVGLSDKVDHYGRDAVALAYTFGAATLWAAGFPARSLEWTAEGLAQAKAMDNPLVFAQALMHSCIVSTFAGEERTRRLLIEYEAEKRTASFGYFWPLMQLALAWTDPLGPDAVSKARAGIAALTAVGAPVAHSNHLGLLAQVELANGLVEEARASADAARSFAETHNERGYLPDALRVAASVRRYGEKPITAEAEQLLRSGLRVARDTGALGQELRVGMDLAELLEEQGNCAEARALLESIYDRFTEGFDTPPLVDARKRLEALST